MDSHVNVPLCKLYPHKLIQFYYSTASRSYPKEQGLNLAKDRKKAYSGKISSSAKRIIEERLTAWHMITQAYNLNINPREQRRQKRLVFVTLTLSSKQKHTDMWIKETLLEQFLKDLKYRFSLKNYFWCAEKQKNGNLHFHLIVDIFIDKEVVRNLWNSVQDYHGYLNDYKKQFGKVSAPSTFVEVISNQKKAIGYVMKYVSKSSAALGVKGRCWSMSSSIQLLAIPAIFIDSTVDDFLEHVRKHVGINYYNEDFFSVLRFGADVNIFEVGVPGLSIYRYYYEGLAKAFYDLCLDDRLLDLMVLYYVDKVEFDSKTRSLSTLRVDYSNIYDCLIT